MPVFLYPNISASFLFSILYFLDMLQLFEFASLVYRLYINFCKKMVRVHNLWLSANLNWATKNRTYFKRSDFLFFNLTYFHFRFINSVEVFWNWHISHKLGYLLSRAYAFILFHTMSCQRAISVFAEYWIQCGIWSNRA